MAAPVVHDAPAIRCPWPGTDPRYVTYHDTEWGVPVYDDGRIFEFLLLEGAQAGLSWSTILRKREHYRAAFAGFDPEAVARFDSHDVERLLADPGIVRNRRKVEAAVSNARFFLAVRDEFGGFARYIWQFTNGHPIQNAWDSLAEIPVTSPEARSMSADLMKRGFRFVGPTIMYAHMQATGMVNDHLVSCFRHGEVKRMARSLPAAGM
jgi:DNA-3-methyladenine glycosylase I